VTDTATLTGRPGWIRVRRLDDATRQRIKESIHGIATVCQEANCPNIGECWSRGTATYMIMGHVCTRNCAFCDVDFGRPEALNPHEPLQLADSVERLGLKYVVITCVDRDDLGDSGAGHWAATIENIRLRRGALALAPDGQWDIRARGDHSGDIFTGRYISGTGVEILSGDFKGRAEDVATVVRSRPDVFAHNVETVPRLQKLARHKANWETSLRVLDTVRAVADSEGITMFTKTGMMLGLGESNAEVREAMALIRARGVQLLTLGQYLKPRNVNGKLAMDRWVTPDEFEELRQYGLELGFLGVAASPLTRSSHLAETLYAEALAQTRGWGAAVPLQR
jgi:lipoic acid synthetase